MGNAGAAAAGMAEAPVTLKQSVDGILMKVSPLPGCAMAAGNCKSSDSLHHQRSIQQRENIPLAPLNLSMIRNIPGRFLEYRAVSHVRGYE